MGIGRCKDSADWRLMQRYEYIKTHKGSGKSIIAAARMLAEIVWAMLSNKEDFNCEKMGAKYSYSNIVV